MLAAVAEGLATVWTTDAIGIPLRLMVKVAAATPAASSKALNHPTVAVISTLSVLSFIFIVASARLALTRGIESAIGVDIGSLN